MMRGLQFIVFRFTSGAGAFMLLSAVPIWMNEVTPPRNRGLLVDLHGAGLLFGYMVAAWVGYGFFHIDSANTWRGPLGEFASILGSVCGRLTRAQLCSVCQP